MQGTRLGFATIFFRFFGGFLLNLTLNRHISLLTSILAMSGHREPLMPPKSHWGPREGQLGFPTHPPPGATRTV